MDAFATMTSTLQRIGAQQTPEERRRAKHQRYYQRNRDARAQWQRLYRRLQTLRQLAPLFTEAA